MVSVELKGQNGMRNTIEKVLKKETKSERESVCERERKLPFQMNKVYNMKLFKRMCRNTIC